MNSCGSNMRIIDANVKGGLIGAVGGAVVGGVAGVAIHHVKVI